MIGALRTSHRARVRAGWSAALGAVLLVVAALVVFVPNTGHKTVVPIDYSHRPKVVRTPPTVPLAQRDRTAIVASGRIRRIGPEFDPRRNDFVLTFAQPIH